MRHAAHALSGAAEPLLATLYRWPLVPFAMPSGAIPSTSPLGGCAVSKPLVIGRDARPHACAPSTFPEALVSPSVIGSERLYYSRIVEIQAVQDLIVFVPGRGLGIGGRQPAAFCRRREHCRVRALEQQQRRIIRRQLGVDQRIVERIALVA